MSAHPPAPAGTLFAQAWTILSVVVAVGLLGMFTFGDHLLHAGGAVWALLRYLSLPVI